MRAARWVIVATMVAGSMWIGGGAAVADHTQGTGLNCDGFQSQAAAQGYLRAHPYDPEGLDGPIGPNNDNTGTPGVACENRPNPRDEAPVFYQAGGTATTATTTATIITHGPDVAFVAPTDAPGDDLDCAHFPSQAAAQANLRANPSDPNNLDGDNDGVACELVTVGAYPDPARDLNVVLAARSTTAIPRASVAVTGAATPLLIAVALALLATGWAVFRPAAGPWRVRTAAAGKVLAALEGDEPSLYRTPRDRRRAP